MENLYGEKVVISLTTFPARINVVPRVIKSILAQSARPDKVVLYLTEPEFPDKNLPQELTDLAKNPVFEIRWVKENFKPYNKLFYALTDFPDDVIITVDDDVNYPKHLVRTLLRTHKKYPRDICTNRMNLIDLDLPHEKWDSTEKRKFFKRRFPRGYNNFFNGVGGVLYPPKSLPAETLRADIFTKLTPNNDDIWFWAMAVRNGTKISATRGGFGYSIDKNFIGEAQKFGLWARINSRPDRPNNAAFKKVLEKYPEVAAAVRAGGKPDNILTIIDEEGAGHDFEITGRKTKDREYKKLSRGFSLKIHLSEGARRSRVIIELPFRGNLDVNFSRGGADNAVIIRKNVWIMAGVVGQYDSGNRLEIGENLQCFGELSFLMIGNKIKIGKDCLFASKISFLMDGHSVLDAKTRECINIPEGETVVEDHVWLGNEVILLKNAHVPRNCIVPARTVATKKFTEPNCLIAGNPAEVKKKGIDWDYRPPFKYRECQNGTEK